jgi:hypothetical protein
MTMTIALVAAAVATGFLADPASATSLQQRRMVDGCDVGGGGNDIQSIATEYQRGKDRIEVTLRLCAAAKRGVTYRLHVDHAAPFVGDTRGCTDASEATIIRGPKGHRGKGRSEVEGSTVRFVVPLGELGVAGPEQVPVIFLWADSRSGGTVDGAPNREGGDGCGRPQARSETLAQTRAVNGNLVWIGSVPSNGQFMDGVDDANIICTDGAQEYGLPGSFMAWFSAEGRFPVQALAPAQVGPLYTADGTLVAQSVADLANCTKGGGTDCLLAPINRDVTGLKVAATSLTWTGTQPNGTPASTPNCNDWLTGSPRASGDGGSVTATSTGWTTGSIGPCSAQRSLICLQVSR